MPEPSARLQRLRQWNRRLNGLPRKALLIAITLLGAWLLALLAPYCWPFLLGLVFSLMLEPFVRFCLKHNKRIRWKRGPATLVGMLLLFGVAGVVFTLLAGRLARELVGLARGVPAFIAWLTDTVYPELQALYARYSDILPASVMTVVDSTLSGLGDTAVRAAGSVSAWLTTGAVSTATSIPGALLAVVLTVMNTYYLTADRPRILAFLKRTFPPAWAEHASLVKRNLSESLFGQVKSQLLVSLIITAFLVLSLSLFGVRYGLVIGLIIGVCDALPVVGAGLFLIPWSLFEFVLGTTGTGVFIAAVYVGTIVLRQICEPRIVGRALGLYPLATMTAMYAGYRLLGFLGLLAGPILLNLLKVVLAADAER